MNTAVERIPAALLKPFTHCFYLLLLFGIEMMSIVDTVQRWVFGVVVKKPQL